MKVVTAFLLILVVFAVAAAQADEILLVRILSGGEIRLANEPLGTIADLNPLKTRLAKQFNKSHQVNVEADKSLSLSDVLNVLRTLRDLRAKPLSLKVAATEGDFTVMIPVPADPAEGIANLRPNPLTLVVRVGADDRLYLNGEAQKSQWALLARLRQIFDQRKKMKAFRPGSHEIEATLFLKPHLTLSFTKAISLLTALHDVGANPLGLQIDDLGDAYTPSNDPCPDEHAWTGRYRNYVFGFSIVIPNGLKGYWNSGRCAPDEKYGCVCMNDHGRFIPLSSDTNIEALVGYQMEPDWSLLEHERQTISFLTGDKQNQNVTVVRSQWFRLGSLRTRRFEAQYVKNNKTDGH